VQVATVSSVKSRIRVNSSPRATEMVTGVVALTSNESGTVFK
jgi:hypothetical protein